MEDILENPSKLINLTPSDGLNLRMRFGRISRDIKLASLHNVKSVQVY